LAQKIILETDELYFLRKAHRSPIYFTAPYHRLRFTMPMLGEEPFTPGDDR
jgi:hypothetical protein